MKTNIFYINNYPWGRPEICPVSFATLNLCDDGILVHLFADEENIRATVTEDNGPVCQDSCLEFFFSPCPAISNAYFNFEINPLGTLYVGFSADGTRKSSKSIDFSKYKKLFNINVIRDNFHWEASYKVPYILIKNYFSDFCSLENSAIKCNFYKCGDKTLYPHYATWNNINSDVVKAPDFHVVDYFGDFKFD